MTSNYAYRGVVTGIFLLSNRSWLDTSAPNHQIIFLLMGVLCGIHIINYAILASISGRGGPMEVHKRKTVSTWVLIHLINMLFELVFYCLSIWQIIDLYDNGPKAAVYDGFVAMVVWCSIMLFCIFFEIIDWVLHFDSHGKLKYAYYETFLYGNGDDKTEAEKKELIELMHQISGITFTKVMRKLLKDDKINSNEKDRALAAVSAVVSDFIGDLDLTTSDVMLGMMLLRWQSNQWIGGQTQVPAKFILDQTDPVLDDVAAPLFKATEDPFENLEKNWLHISRLRRYSHLVNGAYGWLFYYAQNPCDCIAVNRLCNKLSWRNAKATKKQIDLENGIKGPGGCLCMGENCYLAAFLEMSHLRSEDILLFDLTDAFYEAAIIMVIDDTTEAIVIVVRGTLSGEDTLADMVALGESIQPEVVDAPHGSRFVAHGGMVHTARNLSKRIIDEKWVVEARKLRPNYPLVLCGHSLGAGLVSLMSVLLKPHFPEIKAYAFSPPGGLMNENLANHSRDFVVSLIYGLDCIGRLGGHTLEDLRARLFHALSVFKKPKFVALSNRLLVAILRLLPVCHCLPKIGQMTLNLNKKTQRKLLVPNLMEVFETPVGSKLKPNLQDRETGCPYIERLLPSDRSLMNWKNPECHRLLVLPRPYPRSLYPEALLDPVGNSVDAILQSMTNPISSARILLVVEVDTDFPIENVRKFNKRGYKPPPIALWANPNTLNTLLIHPKVLFHHSPIFLSTALDRLYNNVCFPDRIYPKIHMNTWYSENKSLQKAKRDPVEYTDQYCRIRKVKSLV